MRPTLSLMLAALAALAVPAAAHAQGTEEQQQACTGDAVKLCSDTIPDIPKTTACMKAHFSQLTPRCQAAFNDATGGKPATKTATRKAEPRTRTATRAERRLPERAAPARPEREDVAPPPRAAREAALPPRDDTDPTVPPQVAGYPPFPSPEAPVVRAPVSPRTQITQACRDGLIDSFTCSNTVPALLGAAPY